MAIKEFVGVAILKVAGGWTAFLELIAFAGSQYVVIELGCFVINLVLSGHANGMVFAGLKLRQGCPTRGHDPIVSSRPITVKPMREMRAQTVELQRLAQDHFDRPIEPKMSHPATPKLAVNNSVLIFVPIPNAEALPVENHRLKIIRRGADELCDCIVFVQHQKLIHIAMQHPISRCSHRVFDDLTQCRALRRLPFAGLVRQMG